jgi:hypothetical protein
LFALKPGIAAEWKTSIPLKSTFRPETAPEQQVLHRLAIYLLLLRRADAEQSQEGLKKAIGLLKELATESPKDQWDGYLQGILAIAHRSLSNPYEAAKCVQVAREWMKQREKNDKPLSWQERFELKMLLP